MRNKKNLEFCQGLLSKMQEKKSFEILDIYGEVHTIYAVDLKECILECQNKNITIVKILNL